jgi:hypothetical protein
MSLSNKRILIRSILAVILCLTFLSAGAAGADDRFVDNGDGTVTDSKTGLMWAKTDSSGDISWHDAKLYCEYIILSDYTDWRMPTIEELETLFDDSLDGYKTICGHKVKATSQIELSCGFVWSSEVRSISALAYNYSRGYRYSSRMSQYRGIRALPVRNVGE